MELKLDCHCPTWWKQVRDEFDLSKAARGKAKTGKRAGTSVRQRIEERNESHYLEKLKQTDVIVIKGTFDKVEVAVGNGVKRSRING